MKDILFILDRAHGKDVKGKASPDGTHKEWEWSDKFIDILKDDLDKLKIPYVETVTEDYEVGLAVRVNRANEYAENVKYPIFLSFHNNAGGGYGNELFIKRNYNSDEVKIANIFIKNIKENFKENRWRTESNKHDYKLANFIVLAGTNKLIPKYNALLFEYLFMDNDKDLIQLKNKKSNIKFKDVIFKSIVDVCREYGYGNFLNDVNIIALE